MSEKSVNKVTLLGRVGGEPKSATMPNGTSVINFSVATGKAWKDQNGEKHERTEWHRVTAFGKLAEIGTSYLNKGQRIYLEGEIRTRSYKDKDGSDRYVTEIIADEFVMLTPGNEAPATRGHHVPDPQPDNGMFDDDLPF